MEPLKNTINTAFFYSSSREYLKAVFKYMKQNHQLSMEKFAQKLNLGSSNIKMILTGRRNLSFTQLHNIGKALKLSTDEIQYLESLILKEKSKTPTEKRFYANRAKKVKENYKLESSIITKKEILMDPISVPILVYLTDFIKPHNLDENLPLDVIEKISIKFGVKTERIKQILFMLKNSGVYLKKKNPNQEIHYVFDQLTHLLNQKKYIISWLEEAKNRVDRDYNNPMATFNASTLSIKKENIPELKKDLIQLVEKYMSEPFEQTKDYQLAQICIQIIPLLQP